MARLRDLFTEESTVSERARWREREAEGVILRYIKVNIINIASRIQGRIEEPIKVKRLGVVINTHS